ncbi:MAG TPA: hypothetical protein VF070_28700 [Streptosporangiaceae bacterium]
MPCRIIRRRRIGPSYHDCCPGRGVDFLPAALGKALAPQTRARAATVVGAIRTDGATVAATRLMDEISREKPSVSA